MFKSVVYRKPAFRAFFPLKEMFFCALACAAFPAFSAAPAPITHSAREQVNALVMAMAQKQVVNQAIQQGWQDYSDKLEIFIPPAVANAQPCPQKPELSDKGESTKGINRMTFNVVCPAANWQFMVTVKPQIYVPVVMAQGDIARGEIVTADRLVMKKFNISNGRDAYVTDINSLVGMTAKRNISPARPITLGMLQMPILVKRDQPVMMMSDSGNIQIQTQGTALKDGRKGEAIRVRNDSSQRIVTATVADSGVVKISG
ncbi:flagellar basal body P-ring formation chaperone FlgA [Atlantibacter sp.]|uniref:flagellar basal body P-ring formation chaperone FlgA n=1 Tax=Atlantibacter sp. TaxID=1903473 RepID=UPI0028980B9B|nr:flagellar basal body P-ring formation chaperone FlgA [Atlantibacter sp.]